MSGRRKTESSFQTMIRRFRPYLPYLRSVRSTLAWAILAGIIQAASGGAGLPLMVNYVFPRVFEPGSNPLPGWQIVAVVMWLPIVFIIRGLAGYASSYLFQVA